LGTFRVKRSQVAVELRKSWLFAAAALAVLGALLTWTWADGGERPLSPQSVPATLPQVSR